MKLFQLFLRWYLNAEKLEEDEEDATFSDKEFQASIELGKN